MTQPISRFPVPDVASLPDGVRAHGFTDDDIWDISAITALFGLSNRMANLSSMQPNPEFYLMGPTPKAAPADKP